MPYTRRTSKRPYRGRAKNKSLTQPQKRAVTAIAKKTVRMMSEWKFFNLDLSLGTNQAGAVTHLSAVPQNDTVQGREGIVIQPSSLILRYYWESNVALQSHNVVRTIIFQWHPDTTLPTVGDILNLLGTNTRAPLSLYKREGAMDYKILYDRTHVLNTFYAADMSCPVVSTKIRIPRRKMLYDGGTTFGEQNSVYMLNISDEPSASGTDPTVRFASRLNYRDG